MIGKMLYDMSFSLVEGCIFGGFSALGSKNKKDMGGNPTDKKVLSFDPSSWVVLFIQEVKGFGEIAHQSHLMDTSARIGDAQQNQNSPRLHMPQAYTDGLCGGQGGGVEDESFSRFSEMSSYIWKTFQNIRDA
jgi:hypothetical protein